MPKPANSPGKKGKRTRKRRVLGPAMDLPADRAETLRHHMVKNDQRRAVMGESRALEELIRKSYAIGEVIALMSQLSAAECVAIAAAILGGASHCRICERIERGQQR